MKNQYYGDVNDFRKYGLIRTLIGKGEIKTGIFWMLTPQDGRTDGKFLSYLQQPQKWRSFDAELFDSLYQHVYVEEGRNLSKIESSSLLSGMKFHSEILEDDIEKRKKYFEVMGYKFSKVDFLFFDPDNGFKVKSTPLGRTGSSKYLYWDEFSHFFSKGHSILVNQHFTREKRSQFIERVVKRIKSQSRAEKVYSFSTAHVVFFLACQKRHQTFFEGRIRHLFQEWKNQISPLEH